MSHPKNKYTARDYGAINQGTKDSVALLQQKLLHQRTLTEKAIQTVEHYRTMADDTRKELMMVYRAHTWLEEHGYGDLLKTAMVALEIERSYRELP